MRTIDTADINQKTVLIRVDFNVPFLDGERLKDHKKVECALPTIKYAIDNRAKVVVVSHLGRPSNIDKQNKTHSMIFMLDELEKQLQTRVHFSNLEEAEACLQTMKFGEVLLLENIRFYPQEISNDDDFAQKLSSIADVYVNETFACSHRDHASITSITKFLPSFAGFHLKREIETLTRIVNKPKKPVLLIMGGRKVETKLSIVQKFIKMHAPFKVALGGVIANNVLKSMNYEIGKSITENSTSIQLNPPDILELPQDAITTDLKKNTQEHHVCSIEDIPQHEYIVDLGPATIMKYIKLLNQSGTVIWNGPLGYCEFKQFRAATEKIAHHIHHLTMNQKITSLIGGGETIGYLHPKTDKFSHISVGGGAFLQWMNEQILVGIEALERNIMK